MAHKRVHAHRADVVACAAGSADRQRRPRRFADGALFDFMESMVVSIAHLEELYYLRAVE
jgi:hypothetical protein